MRTLIEIISGKDEILERRKEEVWGLSEIVNPASRQFKEDQSTQESLGPSTSTSMALVVRMGLPSVLQTRIQMSISEKLTNRKINLTKIL